MARNDHAVQCLGFDLAHQKKILGLVQASDEEKGKARRTAFLASRLNVALSIPMLFFMVASGGIFRTALFPIAS